MCKENKKKYRKTINKHRFLTRFTSFGLSVDFSSHSASHHLPYDNHAFGLQYGSFAILKCPFFSLNINYKII